MTEPTRVKLHRELLSAGLLEMASKALTGYYDDYESPLATPIVQLVIDLTSASRPDLAQRARNGEWDGTLDESTAWFEREGKQLLKEM